MTGKSLMWRIGGLALVAAALVAAPLLAPPSQLYTFTDIAIYALFAVSFNLLFGYAGMLSFGHAAYFGVGAYACALLLSHHPETPVLLALGAAVVAAGTAGALIGFICVRRTGPYFAMLTMAFGMLIYLLAWKWRSITGGDDGFGSFTPAEIWLPVAGSFRSTDLLWLYVGVLAIVIPALAGTWALVTFTPYGNAIQSIRMNEERAAFLGFNVFVIKITNYAMACGLAGLAGALYAVGHDFITPQLAGLEQSTDVVMMTFIGGARSFFGPLIGASIFITAGDMLSSVTERWQMIMGAVFIFMVMFVPHGIVGLAKQAAKLRRPAVARRGAAKWA